MAFRPTTINILGKVYSVTYCSRPSDVDIYGRQSLWGQVDYWTRTIRIYETARNETDVLQGLLHECIHAISEELDLGLKKEKLVDMLAMALGDLLIRNGWLGKWPMQGRSDMAYHDSDSPERHDPTPPTELTPETPWSPDAIRRAVDAHHWPPPTQWIADMLVGIAFDWAADRAALAEARRRLLAISQGALRVYLKDGIVGDWDGAFDWEGDFSGAANYAALPVPKEDEPCLACGQKDTGQTGEHECGVCGLPMLWDAALAASGEKP